MRQAVIFYSSRYLMVCILLNTISTTNGSIVTSVAYLFETFSPYAVIRFFEFSDKGWNISENCLKDMYVYLEGLRRGSIWAAKLYDATSFYAGAAFASSNIRISNPNICRSLLHEYKQILRTPWKLLDLNGSVVPFPVHIVIGHYLVEIVDNNYFKNERIQQLICFPQSCGDEDLQQILEVHLFQSNHIVRNNTYLKHRILSDNYSIIHDSDCYVLISISLTAALVYSVVYISSCTCEQECKSRTSSENILRETTGRTLVQNIQNHNLPKIATTPKTFYIQEIVDALSIQNVIYNVLQHDSNEVATAQSALSIIFAMLISYFHLAAEIKFLSNNFRPGIDDPYAHELPTYVLDMFFVISGSKMAQNFLRTFPREELNVFEQLMYISTLVIHKMFSLTPSYIIALFVERLLARYFYYNIAIEVPSFDVNTCRNNLWSNILYMDLFYPLTERCMPWTWFISLEVQFFITLCLILLLAEIHRKYAMVIGTILFITSLLAASFTEAQRHIEQQSKWIRNTSVLEIMEFNLIFDNVCLRVAPYLLGICLGYILHITNSRITLNAYVIISGWIVCTLIGSLLLFGHKLVLFASKSLLSAALITLQHTMCALIIFWIILVSATQHGEILTIFAGHKLSTALVNVSPVALLIGPIVIRLLIFTADIPIYSSEGHIFLVGLGCLPLIYTCAFVLFVFIDRPILTVLSVLLKRRFKTMIWKRRWHGKVTI